MALPGLLIVRKMGAMGRALALALLLLVVPTTVWGQTLVVLRIRAVLLDAAGTSTPVARHALLISDNPPTREPRRVFTSLDGTVDVRLRPGNYTVESDRPVVFQGKAYEWTQTLNVVAGRDSALELTAANAKTEAIEAGPADAGAPPRTDPWLSLRQWFDSVVELWTPTAHASGFIIGDGLIATHQRAVGDATSVEVQLSRSVKVAGTVVEADRDRDVAVVRIDPATVASVKPVPLGCSTTGAPPAVERGNEIFTVAVPLRQEKGISFGTVERVAARSLASDLRVAIGGLGGPVFSSTGDVVGITTLDQRAERSREASRVVRLDDVCAVVAASMK